MSSKPIYTILKQVIKFGFVAINVTLYLKTGN